MEEKKYLVKTKIDIDGEGKYHGCVILNKSDYDFLMSNAEECPTSSSHDSIDDSIISADAITPEEYRVLVKFGFDKFGRQINKKFLKK